MAYLDTLTKKVNILPTGIPTPVHLSQSENGRTLSFEIVGGSGELPAGSVVTLTGTKPDGVVYSAVGTLSGNIATFEEDVQLTAAAGVWPAKIEVTNGGHMIATGRISFTIDADPVAPGSVPSESELDGLVAQAAMYAENARSAAYGSPLTAATAADMIDTTRVYVYTGSETGMENGHWYYWEDGSWKDGGIYNAAAVQTDTSLSIPGMAADAKATGEAIAAEATAREQADTDLKADLSDVENWLGYPKNLFDGTFTTTHSSNWSISQDGNDVTFTHLSQYESGYPSTGVLGLPVGTYHFTANFNGTANLLALCDTTPAWVKTLTEDCTFTIEEGKTYYIRIGVLPAQGESVTVSNIVITADGVSTDGKIGEIESEIEAMQSSVSNVDALVASAKETIQPVSDTVKKFISNTGAISDTGSSDFYVSEYAIEENTNYWISASTMWANAYWAWYSGETLVSVGQISPKELTAIQNVAVTAPSGANILYVTHHAQSIDANVEKIGLGYNKRWFGKKWVCVGDSLTAVNVRTTKHYFDYVADATGITPVNMGYSGSGYARLANENHAFYQRISDCPTDADVVTIFGSFNDLGAGLPIGSVDDTETTTLAGCINTTIDNLQAVIPLVNLGIVAPTPWATAVPATSGADFNYVEMIKAICERRSIPFLDLWRCSNLRPWDADFRELAYSKDGGSGTHPDENGHKLIAPRFKAFLETLLM